MARRCRGRGRTSWAILALAGCVGAPLDHGASRSAGSCTPPTAVAVLLIGFVRTDAPGLAAAAVHLRAIRAQVVAPLSADVHAAYEVTACARAHDAVVCVAELTAAEALVDAALQSGLGERVRSVTVVRGGASRALALGARRVTLGALGVTHAYAAEPELAHSRRAPKLYATTLQWFKLSEAWRQMEAAEAASGQRYSAVVKLRFDVVPLAVPHWQLCVERDLLHARDPPAVHAMSDIAFWGRRDAMAVAASLWGNIAYFEAELPDGSGRPALLTRPVAVEPTLRSVLSLPSQAFTDWTLYQKIGHVNVPDMRVQVGARVRYKPGVAPKRLDLARLAMLANLRAARAAGWEWIDPLRPVGAQPNVTAMVVCGGESGRCVGRRDGVFVTERDFVQWLLVHNVTVCDLGASTQAVLHKGRAVRRAARNGCASADSDSDR